MATRKNIIMAIVLNAATIMSAASTDWITTSSDAEYPSDLYFVGVGMSERSMEMARQNAMVEVKKQLSVKVNAATFDEQVSVMSNGVEKTLNRVESRARLTTSGQVEGIQVVKTEQKNRVNYAFAVLDKKNFEINVRTKIGDLKDELDEVVEGAKADIAATRISSALYRCGQARRLIGEIAQQRTMLTAVGALTDKERPNVTATDLFALYEQCVGTLRLVKVSGDNQSCATGATVTDPFAVIVYSNTTPVSAIPVRFIDAQKKVLAEKISDDQGRVEWYGGDALDVSKGSHSVVAAIRLNVSAERQKILTAQNQTFTYKVTSSSCATRIVVTVPPLLMSAKNDLTDKVVSMLGKYDIVQTAEAPTTLVATVSATETSQLQGLSENNTFIKTEVTISLSLKNDDDKEIGSITGTGKGMGGTFVKSIVSGIGNAKIQTDLATLREKICSLPMASGPKLKIAIFEFKSRNFWSGWYDISSTLSDMITTQLINTGKFDVVERSQIERIMEEKSLAQSGVVEESEALQIAQLAGADVILIGSAGITGNKIEADARIVDMKTGVAKCAMNSATFSLSDLRLLANDLVGQIKGKCAK